MTRYLMTTKCCSSSLRGMFWWATLSMTVAAVAQEPKPQPEAARAALEEIFREALYVKEVKGDTAAALEAYEKATASFEHLRDLAATALFRQGECLRKLNRPEDAAACYFKILALYPDQGRILKLSRENLVALGKQPEEAGRAATAVTADEETREIARLEELIRNSPDLLHTPLGEALPPLHEAAGKGQLRVLEFLLEKGAEVNSVVNEGTALHRAAAAGHLAACESLIKAGADVNLEVQVATQGRIQETRTQGTTPLTEAILNERAAVVGLLLKSGADPNGGSVLTRTGKASYPEPPILSALGSSKARLQMAQMLRESGADLKRAGTLGYTLLHKAAEFGLQDWIEIGLDAGIDVNVRYASDNSTPLHVGVYQPASVEALIKAGADLNATDWDGGTPLLRVVSGSSSLSEEQRKNRLSVMKLLLDAGADPNADSKSTGSALTMALGGWNEGRCWMEAARLLLAHGANPKITGRSGRNAPPFPAVSDDARPLKGDILALYEECWETAYFRLNPERPHAIWLNSAKDVIYPDQPESEGGHGKARTWVSSYPEFRAVIGRESGAHSTSLAQFIRMTPVRGSSTLSFTGQHARPSSPRPRRFAGRQPKPAGRGATSPAALPHVPSTWREITIRRLSPDGQPDQFLKVDFVDLVLKGQDFPLEMGDVVIIPKTNLPVEKSGAEQVGKWYQEPGEVEIRIEPGENQVLSNTTPEEGNVFRSQWPGTSMPIENVLLAGSRFIIGGVSREVWRCESSTGELARLDPAALMHGDVVRLRVDSQPLEAMSERRLSRGVYLCSTEAGPHRQIYSGSLPSMALLMLGIVLPNGLPVQPVDWEKARVRVNWKRNENGTTLAGDWHEYPLIESLDLAVDGNYGTILILPPAEGDRFELEPDLAAAITERLTIDWDLYVDNAPKQALRFEPRLLTCEKQNDRWVWRRDHNDLKRLAFPMVSDAVKAAAPDLYWGRDYRWYHPFEDRWLAKPSDPAGEKLSVRVSSRSSTSPVISGPSP